MREAACEGVTPVGGHPSPRGQSSQPKPMGETGGRTRDHAASEESADLENQFELDAHVEGEFGGAEGQAGVASRLAENLDEEVRGRAGPRHR